MSLYCSLSLNTTPSLRFELLMWICLPYKMKSYYLSASGCFFFPFISSANEPLKVITRLATRMLEKMRVCRLKTYFVIQRTKLKYVIIYCETISFILTLETKLRQDVKTILKYFLRMVSASLLFYGFI